MRVLRSASVVVVGCLGLFSCGAPGDDPNARWRFAAPQLVQHRSDGALRSTWPVAAPGGRTFLALTTARPDGTTTGVSVVERNGTTWTAPTIWPAPSGAGTEAVLWTTSDPGPAVLTRADGPQGPVLYARRFVGDAWTPPEPVTLQGSEAPVLASLGVGASGALRVVYAVPGGSCTDGAQLRYRERGPTGWSASRPVADTCGLDRVSLAVDPSADDALLVTWTGPVRGAASAAATDVVASASATASGGATMFRPPYRVLTGDNRGAQAVALGGGRFLAGWSLTTTSPSAPGAGSRRAAFNTYDAPTDRWETANTGWYPTDASPWLVGLAKGAGALAFGADGAQPRAQLVMRTWASPERPSTSRNVIASPLGTASSLRAIAAADGTVQATWIETDDGGGQRLLFSVALPVAAGDAGGR
ncbi:MAG: hypothetical protein JWM10_1835 [Myxococcaceae bacterium]|nr:hypothetical protein [Myxococcaceae bacterium]